MTEYIVHSGKDVSSLIIGEDGGVTPVPFVVTPRPDHLPELAEAKALLASRDEAWLAGVQAARDAVAAIPHWDEDSGESSFRAFDKDAALAAIDALGRERS